jgi:3-oxoadipate enol-lactonase
VTMGDDGTLMDLPGGRRLFVSVREADGAGLPILFLNSLAADLTMWDGVRSHLSRRNVAYDARGHGRSPAPEGDCTVEDLARDALAVMDATGLDRAILCGLSLGGATAMAMARLAPERVAGLVLANTAVSFPPPEMWRERAATARAGGYGSLVAPTLARWLTEGFQVDNPETTEAVRTMIAGTSPEGYAACCAALAAADVGAALGGYAGPVLVIAGAHDQSTPVARAEEMQAIRPGADLAVLDAAHLSSVEAEADFAGRLSHFIAELGETPAHA